MVFEQKPDEDLRYFGEITIKGMLAKHLWSIYQIDGDYNKEDFNNMMSHISNHYTLFLQEQPFVNLLGRLEAFIGAVDKISDDLYFGTSFINCYRLIELIFKKHLIPYHFRFKHPKTTVEQLLVPFLGKEKAKPIVKIEYDAENHINTFEISLNPFQLQFLNTQGFKLIPLLSYHTGQNKKQTQKEAYQLALDTLTSHGITVEWANVLKRNNDFALPKLLPYKHQLDMKMKNEGYDYLYFASPLKTTTLTEVTIQLVGVNEQTKQKTILSSILANPELDKQEAKLSLILNFLKI